MSQSAVNVSVHSNRSSGTKDPDPASSVAARLRSNKQTTETGQKVGKESATPANQNPEASKTSTDNNQAEDPPARMTRQRTATTAQPEESLAQKDGESPPQSASSTEAVSQICLCQPDPKIPRPRNAFILYRQNNQQNIISQNQGLSNPEISKIAGSLWRSEPEEVKKVWKNLAEEEKQRHALQYPDYRFQPRHKSKNSPTTGPGEKVRCQKCGGQSIVSTSSPYATPISSTNPKSKLGGTSAFPTSAESPEEAEPTSNPRGAMIPHADPRYVPVGSPLTRRYPDGAIELSDPKRRRYDSHASTSSIARPELTRAIITTGQAPTSAHPAYPSPRMADPRRCSLSATTEGPYHFARGSIGTVESPPPTASHATAQLMGPPLSRGASISGRNPLHTYPATPTDARHQSFPHSALSRPRGNSESLRLAPLLSPGAGDQSQSIAAMIMTIPVVGKLGQLRRIAPPIKQAAPPDTPSYRVRGSIIAIEGDDRAASDAMLGQLETYLRRNEEFDVRVLPGPRDPEPGCDLKDYLLMVSKWHDETKRMIDFVTGVEYKKVEDQEMSVKAAEKPNSPAKSGGSEPMDTDDIEEGEVIEDSEPETSSARSKTGTQEKELEKKKEEMAAAVEREARRQSAAAEHSSKIPLLLVSNYILSGSNAWSSTLPIKDVYSPADHWAWTATLWRGIVGADLTVYVRNAEREKEELVSANPNGPPPLERKVEMKDEVGAILVKRDNGKVEDGAVRRVAFEVGEWVRMQAGKVG